MEKQEKPKVGDMFALKDALTTHECKDFEITAIDNDTIHYKGPNERGHMPLKIFLTYYEIIPQLAPGVREWLDTPVESLSIKCECGIDKLGYGNHSDYCPKSKEL